MRATAIDGFGTAPAPPAPAPVPGKGGIRVQVLAVSLNGFDLDAVGPRVTEFVPGESVFGVSSRAVASLRRSGSARSRSRSATCTHRPSW